MSKGLILCKNISICGSKLGYHYRNSVNVYDYLHYNHFEGINIAIDQICHLVAQDSLHFSVSAMLIDYMILVDGDDGSADIYGEHDSNVSINK